MVCYSRNFLFSCCLWWKPSVNIQSSRHCLTADHRYWLFPLDPLTWNTLKSLDLLRKQRGKRGGRSSVKDKGASSKKSPISTQSQAQINIHDCQFLRSAWTTSVNRTSTNCGANLRNLLFPHRTPLKQESYKYSKLCLLNSRSVCNKMSFINDFVIEHNVDLLCLTETWLNANNSNYQSIINELTPKGYLFENVPRKTRGGGVGILFKKGLKLKKLPFLNLTHLRLWACLSILPVFPCQFL